MSTVITYVFRLDSGAEYQFDVDLARPESGGDLPDWTLLKNDQCAHCPLAAGPGARCPAAADLVPVLARFSALASIDSVEVRVVREQYEARKTTDTQTALSALMGLILATSGCPILNRIRPLAYTHSPFASETEIVYRIATMHLFESFLSGSTPDLRKLSNYFEDLEKLNLAFATRIKRATERDASVNALVVLHSRSLLASMSIDHKMSEILEWFPREPAAHLSR